MKYNSVFVTGGSGFVGSAVLEELSARGYRAVALSHSRKVEAAADRVAMGSLFDAKALDEGMKGCDAVIHIVGIIMEKPSAGVTFERIHYEGARNVMDAAKRAGIGRFIHMSALGTRANAVSRYHRTKFMAEEYLRESELEWTIFRPSMIHGPKGEFMHMEAAWARKKAPPFLFMPYFGAGALGRGGAGNLQPVYVKDIARAFVDALEKPATIGEVYPLCGEQVVSWPEMHRICAKAIIGRERLTVAIPAWYAKIVTGIAPRGMLPFNRDQVIMSQEDNTADMSKFIADFGWTPRPFAATLDEYKDSL